MKTICEHSTIRTLHKLYQAGATERQVYVALAYIEDRGDYTKADSILKELTR